MKEAVLLEQSEGLVEREKVAEEDKHSEEVRVLLVDCDALVHTEYEPVFEKD